MLDIERCRVGGSLSGATRANHDPSRGENDHAYTASAYQQLLAGCQLVMFAVQRQAPLHARRVTGEGHVDLFSVPAPRAGFYFAPLSLSEAATAGATLGLRLRSESPLPVEQKL